MHHIAILMGFFSWWNSIDYEQHKKRIPFSHLFVAAAEVIHSDVTNRLDWRLIALGSTRIYGAARLFLPVVYDTEKKGENITVFSSRVPPGRQ